MDVRQSERAGRAGCFVVVAFAVAVGGASAVLVVVAAACTPVAAAVAVVASSSSPRSKHPAVHRYQLHHSRDRTKYLHPSSYPANRARIKREHLRLLSL